MIVIGYQGIGKSTIAGRNGCIDLESGNFWIDGKRDDNWYIPYCKIAEHLSNQGYAVMVSSHEVVRNQLKEDIAANRFRGNVVSIFPDHNLKEEWQNKLLRRWYVTGQDKDHKAYLNALDRYDENIDEIKESGFLYYKITDMNYDLADIIDYYQVTLHTAK